MRWPAWALAVALALVSSSQPLARPAGSGPAGVRPSIVLILTDDQRWDALKGMSTVQSRLIARGVTFTNGFVVNSLCCPSRASILTGQYSHSTGVWGNEGSFGGFQNFDDTSTVATWLDDAGYETALVGKYLNGYDGTTIPPGWDRWVAFARSQGAFYDYELNVDGTRVAFGSAESDYSTDVLAAEAASFIQSVDPSEPFFLMFAPYAPHGPATPAPRHEATFPSLPLWRPPNYDEANVSDKPPWVRKLRRLTRKTRAKLDGLRRKQLQSLLAVDDAVEGVLDALADSGRLQDTMIVYISDNGFLWGEHRKRGKRAAYNESIRIPFVVRYDPLTQARVDGRLALNIDLAPTFAHLAGVEAPAVDGMSLIPVLAGRRTGWRSAFLVENLEARGVVPTFCAVRKAKRVYVRYKSGFEEFYDLRRDPYELVNRAGRPSAAKMVAKLRTKARELCQPPPPGFSF